jgi:hypothetical protein
VPARRLHHGNAGGRPLGISARRRRHRRSDGAREPLDRILHFAPRLGIADAGRVPFQRLDRGLAGAIAAIEGPEAPRDARRIAGTSTSKNTP